MGAEETGIELKRLEKEQNRRVEVKRKAEKERKTLQSLGKIVQDEMLDGIVEEQEAKREVEEERERLERLGEKTEKSDQIYKRTDECDTIVRRETIRNCVTSRDQTRMNEQQHEKSGVGNDLQMPSEDLDEFEDPDVEQSRKAIDPLEGTENNDSEFSQVQNNEKRVQQQVQ